MAWEGDDTQQYTTYNIQTCQLYDCLTMIIMTIQNAKNLTQIEGDLIQEAFIKLPHWLEAHFFNRPGEAEAVLQTRVICHNFLFFWTKLWSLLVEGLLSAGGLPRLVFINELRNPGK